MNTILLTFVYFVAASGATPHDLRVIGGSEARDDQFPHMVSLRYVDSFMGDTHICGATILKPRWIVTAAHCVVGDYPDRYYVKAGTTSLTEDGTIYYIEKIIPHKQYEWVNVTDDIALIYLRKDIKFIKNKVAPLAINTEPLTAGEEVIFGGWGSMHMEGPLLDKLQWQTAKVVHQDICKDLQEPYVEGMICITAGKRHGVCHRDSGSFLMSNGKLVGIVSWARPCAEGYPDVYTRISHFVDWIQKNIIFFDTRSHNM